MTEISRHVIDWDEKGFPCLADDCPDPECGASALIINEWNAVECLTCSWREFEPDDPRADFSKYPDEFRAIGQEEPGGSARGRVTAVRAAARAVLEAAPAVLEAVLVPLAVFTAVVAAVAAVIALLALNGWTVPS